MNPFFLDRLLRTALPAAASLLALSLSAHTAMAQRSENPGGGMYKQSARNENPGGGMYP